MATFRRNRRIDSKLTEELHEEELREEDDWSISGMCLISDENLLVVCDRPQKRLKLFDIDNNIIINHVTLTKQPRSVAAIAGDCVAVTIPEECKIFTYKVCDLRLNMHKMHNFSEHGECYDLDYMDGYLIVTFYPVENGLAALICKYEEEEEVLPIQQIISSDTNHTIGYVTFDRPAYVKCISLPNATHSFKVVICDVSERYVSVYTVNTENNSETLLLWKQRDDVLELKEPRCMVSFNSDTLLMIGRLSGTVASLKICNGHLKFKGNMITNLVRPCSFCYSPKRKELFISCSNIKYMGPDKEEKNKWESNQRFIQVWREQ